MQAKLMVDWYDNCDINAESKNFWKASFFKPTSANIQPEWATTKSIKNITLNNSIKLVLGVWDILMTSFVPVATI